VLCRYADDLVVMCKSDGEAHSALGALRVILAELGLEPTKTTTRIVHLRVGGEAMDFLGFRHLLARGRTPPSRHLSFLVRWPSPRAVQHARDRVREIAARHRLRDPVATIVHELNSFVRGWAGDFGYGNATRQLTAITRFATERLVRFVADRHTRSPGYGWQVVHFGSANRLGLISLDTSVIAPRPNRPWREKPNAGGQGRR
jgi:hypothetical protein